MKDLKLELFNFKNKLGIDQLDEARIAQLHLENCDNFSEKEMLNSLKSYFNPYFWNNDVKLLVETVEEEIESKPLVYELKDLYKKIERKNIGVLYRQPLVTLLEIINKPDDDSRMVSILNELAMYDWIVEIKHFLLKMTSNPIERQNLQNSGKSSKIYTLVEKLEDGHMAFICDSWFLIAENEIKKVLVEDYIKDEQKVRNIRLLEKVLQIADITDNVISFKIDENLVIGLSSKDKSVFLNGEKLDKETTLETLFNSPLVPYLKRDYYSLLETTINNLNKFMELDIALKVTNFLNPFNESFVFNYKNTMYLYSKDTRYGSKFYKYENVMDIIHDVQKDLDYDLTNFYENKVSTELKNLRTLEDKEKQIDLKLKDVNETIDMLKDNEELLKESSELNRTFSNLLVYKDKLNKELNKVKSQKNDSRKLIIK